MAFTVDQAAVAGVGVAGVISVSAADGPYTVFDSVMGVVLLILFLSFYERGTPGVRSSDRFPAAAAAVLAVIFCLVLSPLVEAFWLIGGYDRRDFAVDSTLAAVWIVLFSVFWRSPIRREVPRILTAIQGRMRVTAREGWATRGKRTET
ncbi:hypothetical protein ACIBO1_31325 [Micromonospora sp. NPDC049903]|uniref:hypothetical protein n=1 Tax=Micromonospora sp. NPDC049903 TaxID=3364276 RepID=UPI003794C1A9